MLYIVKVLINRQADEQSIALYAAADYGGVRLAIDHCSSSGIARSATVAPVIGQNQTACVPHVHPAYPLRV